MFYFLVFFHVFKTAFETRDPSGSRPIAAMQQSDGEAVGAMAAKKQGILRAAAQNDTCRSGGEWEWWGHAWWRQDGGGHWGRHAGDKGGADGSGKGGATGSGKWPWSSADGSRSCGAVPLPPADGTDGGGKGDAAPAVPLPPADGSSGATAVAVQGEHGEMFTVDFFKNFRTFTRAYKQHNGALKWFRRKQENLATPSDLLFPNHDHVAVAAIIKGKGMDFDFDETTLWSWSWLEFVAQLDDESIDFVVKGPDDRSCGLWQCSLSMRPGSYDHKRHHMLIKQGTTSKVDKLKVWDFLLVRSDGSTVRLHPNWSNTFVDAIEGSSHETEVEIPWSGLGGSDGPGTYAYYKRLDFVRKLRFDARKHDRKGNKAK